MLPFTAPGHRGSVRLCGGPCHPEGIAPNSTGQHGLLLMLLPFDLPENATVELDQPAIKILEHRTEQEEILACRKDHLLLRGLCYPQALHRFLDCQQHMIDPDGGRDAECGRTPSQ